MDAGGRERLSGISGGAHRSSTVIALLFGLALVGSMFVYGQVWQPGAVFALLVAAALLCALSALLWPSLDDSLRDRPMAGIVAFVGCDGSGKSTLTDDLGTMLSASSRVRICYLGLGSGAIGQKIAQIPLVGGWIEQRLAHKAAQSRTKGEKIPGLFTAIVIYGFSLVRLHRFKRMLRLRRAGYTILTDRYPQTECPGYYDGPGLSAASTGNWAIRQLVEHERRIYRWMASFRPDVIVRLNIDAATALARKPDHRAELIARKVAVTSKLRFGGARIADVDATRAYEQVRSEAARIVAKALTPSPA